MTFSTYLTSSQAALPSFITLSGLTYTVSPTTDAEIGTYSIEAKACDPQLCTTITFTVTVVAAQTPVITNAPGTVLYVNQHTPTTFTLLYSDPLDPSPVITGFYAITPMQPTFATFLSDTYTFQPIDFTQQNTYTITAKICDA